MGIFKEIDKWGWKKDVEKCFFKNYPDHCPKNSPFLESKDISGGDVTWRKTKTINYCKYYSYCHRKYHKKRFKEVFK